MKKILLSLVALTAISASAFASATIISGSNQNVSFDSSPQGATVKIDGVTTCQTPCTVPVSKGFSEKMITVTKDGYENYSAPMKSSYDGVALLNVFWDLSTTDAITGAAWKYSPNTYFFELKKQ